VRLQKSQRRVGAPVDDEHDFQRVSDRAGECFQLAEKTRKAFLVLVNGNH